MSGTSPGAPTCSTQARDTSTRTVPRTRVHVPGAELEVYILGDANTTAQDVDRYNRPMRMPDGAVMC